MAPVAPHPPCPWLLSRGLCRVPLPIGLLFSPLTLLAQPYLFAAAITQSAPECAPRSLSLGTMKAELLLPHWLPLPVPAVQAPRLPGPQGVCTPAPFLAVFVHPAYKSSLSWFWKFLCPLFCPPYLHDADVRRHSRCVIHVLAWNTSSLWTGRLLRFLLSPALSWTLPHIF